MDLQDLTGDMFETSYIVKENRTLKCISMTLHHRRSAKTGNR